MRVLSIPGGPCRFHPHVSTAFLRTVIPDSIVSSHPVSCIWTSAQTVPGLGQLCWGQYMDAHHLHTHPTHICTHPRHTHMYTPHTCTQHSWHTHTHTMHTYTSHTCTHHTMYIPHTPCTHTYTPHTYIQHHTHHTQAAVGALSSTYPHSVPALSLCLELLKPGLCFLVFSSHRICLGGSQ